MMLRRTSRTLPHLPEVSKSSTSSFKLRVAIRGADMVGPSRRARSSTLTMYMGGDGVGVVSFGGEGVVGSDRTVGFWAADGVGAAGAVSTVGIGGAAGVCSEGT
jgi:hypothetical protein